jgi:hypothetical protein
MWSSTQNKKWIFITNKGLKYKGLLYMFMCLVVLGGYQKQEHTPETRRVILRVLDCGSQKIQRTHSYT